MEQLAYSIRPITALDLDSIVDLYIKHVSPSLLPTLIKNTITSHINSILSNPPTYSMVACKDNEIIAVSVCRFRSTIQSYELECAVKTEFRRHKIASNLLKNHIEICKSNGHTYFLANVHPDNTSSIKLVENLGFTLNHELSFGIHKSYQLHLDSSTHRAE